MDLLRREAVRGERRLELSPREFALLEYLCRNAGRVVTRTMVLDRVWGARFDPQTNVVDVYVHASAPRSTGPAAAPDPHGARVGYVAEG